MRSMIFAALPAAALLASAPASAAQLGSYNDPAPGASSLMRSDFSNAEREIRGAKVDASDPARAINLGIALAKNGQRDEAAKLFNSVLAQADVQMVVADGETLSSHQVAERALQSLQSGVLSR
jgi:Flp pilus assembly protein TadD